jgi:hypothetical protein
MVNTKLPFQSKTGQLIRLGQPSQLTGLRLRKLNRLLFNKSSGYSQQTACSAFFCLLLFNLL